ncbi:MULTISPECIES: SIR2 family NAD-dependent protein deacylase [Streptomyces]|uniref:SIR2 family NAD-dependent protein deacylase n=1 Tax=Streptomyces TaxID=1883 RepID=UPI0034202CB3
MSAIEPVSSYADLYGRAKLIERLHELLLVDDVTPGKVHQAFAQLPFDIVVTTNFDFLLEKGYMEQRRPYTPLIGESQLSVQRPSDATYLLKFHGDLNHPDQLIATEEDYDGFVRRHPLLATYLSWYLLTREPVFIGYSLDDPDLREILSLLRERLGRMVRPAWAILPTDPHDEAPKFLRRGIKAIVLNRHSEADPSQVLEDFFGELRNAWEDEITSQLKARTDATTAELRRPPIAPQLALFVASRPLLSLYRDYVFPVARQAGLLTLGIDDVRAQDTAMKPMAIDMAIQRAAVVVYDEGRGSLPLDYIESRRGRKNSVLKVSAPNKPGIAEISEPDTERTERPREMEIWEESFIRPLQERIAEIARASMPGPVELDEQLNVLARSDQNDRLLLTCLALLEREMRDKQPEELPSVVSMGGPIAHLRRHFGDKEYTLVMQAVRLRHDLMQNLLVEPAELKTAAAALYDVVKKRLDLSQTSTET